MFAYQMEIQITSGVQQGDTLAPFLLTIFLNYLLWIFTDLMKENRFTPTRKETEDNAHKLLLTRTMPMT